MIKEELTNKLDLWQVINQSSKSNFTWFCIFTELHFMEERQSLPRLTILLVCRNQWASLVISKFDKPSRIVVQEDNIFLSHLTKQIFCIINATTFNIHVKHCIIQNQVLSKPILFYIWTDSPSKFKVQLLNISRKNTNQCDNIWFHIISLHFQKQKQSLLRHPLM